MRRNAPDRLVLVEIMGTGKSHWARRLARKLRWAYRDCDRLVERAERRSVARIFSEDGESYFRKAESAALRRALEPRRVVVATGGGAVLKKQNRDLMRSSGLVLWLRAGPGRVWARVRGDPSRPLLDVPNPRAEIRRLLKKRNPLYRACADETVRTGAAAAKRFDGILKRHGLLS